MIFVTLIQIQGCVSTKVINSVSDVPISEKYTYIIHSPTTKYHLLNASYSNGILSGNLINGKHAQTAHMVQFYIPADSVLKLDSTAVLSLPVEKISKIELENTAKGATTILCGGILIGILIIIGVAIANAGLSGLND